MTSIRVILSIVAQQKWPRFQMNVKNLHRELHEQIDMDIPPELNIIGHKNPVCILRKSLYGLKQSPRAWYSKLSGKLILEGYKMSLADNFVCKMKPKRCYHNCCLC